MTSKVVKKVSTTSNVSGGSGQPQTPSRDYTGYFYNQIDKLWKEVMILQAENNKLRAQIGSVQ